MKATGCDESPSLLIAGSIVVLAVLARMREPAQLDLDLAVAAGPAATQPADHPAPTR